MVELVILLFIGSLFLYLGWRIWKREQITLIHSYHYKRVLDEDKAAYTETMGKACIVMGIGLLLTAGINFLSNTSYGWLVFGISFLLGIAAFLQAQYKYNGGLF